MPRKNVYYLLETFLGEGEWDWDLFAIFAAQIERKRGLTRDCIISTLK
jgi:hypothetical protein